MSLFHLIGGVFPSIVNIVIDDISELIVDGFHGQTSLAVVEIKNSVFTEIVEDTFKEVKTLERLTFQNTSINTIAPSSLYIPSSSSRLAVKLINCKVRVMYKFLNNLASNRYYQTMIEYLRVKSEMSSRKITRTAIQKIN